MICSLYVRGLGPWVDPGGGAEKSEQADMSQCVMIWELQQIMQTPINKDANSSSPFSKEMLSYTLF